MPPNTSFSLTGRRSGRRDRKRYLRDDVDDGLERAGADPDPVPAVASGCGGADRGAPDVVFGARAAYDLAEQTKDRAGKSGLFQLANSALKFDQLTTEIDIDRETAADLGIDMRQPTPIRPSCSGRERSITSAFRDAAIRFIPQLDRAFRLTPERALDIELRTGSGALVPLSTIATLTGKVRPQQFRRFKQRNSPRRTAVPVPGLPLGAAIGFLCESRAEPRPESYVTDLAGRSRQ